jgi:hypothetical protein
MQDFEYYTQSGTADDDENKQPGDNETSWFLLASTTLPSKSLEASRTLNTHPIRNNCFRNKSLQEINDFIRTNEEKFKELNITSHNWVIIDAKGLETSTCLVVEQKFDDEQSKLTDEFDAARMPFPQAWAMFANLDIANVGFEEFVDEEKGVQDDGAWVWKPFSNSNEGLKRGKKKADAKRAVALKEARESGLID